jgi:hypothetical protein
VAATVPLNELDLLAGEGNLYARVEVALEVRLGAVLHQVALRLHAARLHPVNKSVTSVFRIRNVFGKDQDPQIRTTFLRIRILLFFSMAFTTQTKNMGTGTFFEWYFC